MTWNAVIIDVMVIDEVEVVERAVYHVGIRHWSNACNILLSATTLLVAVNKALGVNEMLSLAC